MFRQNYGRIVNLSSLVALGGVEGCADYAAAKGGIIAATKTDGGGYFVPVEREELMAYVHAAEKQGASTFAPLKAAREKLREGKGQIDIYDLTRARNAENTEEKQKN